MAGTVPISIRLAKVIGGASGESISGLEASSQVFLEGAPLAWSGGFLQVAAAEVSLPNTTPIVGFAAEDAHNITQGTQLIRYYPALPEYVFDGILENDSTNAYVWAQADMGVRFALMADVTNHRWFVDKSVTANAQCRVIETPAAIGDTKPHVRFVITAAGSALLT